MKDAGGVLIGLGVIAVIAAFFVTTSSHVSYTPPLTYSPLNPYLPPPMPSDVVNLWGMHVQALILQAGFATIIAGSVLFGCGAINETLSRNAGAPPEAAPPPPPLPDSTTLYEVVDEEKPDHSMIWIVFVGLGIAAFIIIAILAAQKQSDEAITNTEYDANADMSMDTNMSVDNPFSPPRRRRR